LDQALVLLGTPLDAAAAALAPARSSSMRLLEGEGIAFSDDCVAVALGVPIALPGVPPSAVVVARPRRTLLTVGCW